MDVGEFAPPENPGHNILQENYYLNYYLLIN